MLADNENAWNKMNNKMLADHTVIGAASSDVNFRDKKREPL